MSPAFPEEAANQKSAVGHADTRKLSWDLAGKLALAAVAREVRETAIANSEERRKTPWNLSGLRRTRFSKLRFNLYVFESLKGKT